MCLYLRSDMCAFGVLVGRGRRFVNYVDPECVEEEEVFFHDIVWADKAKEAMVKANS